MVNGLRVEKERMKGIVNEVGLERDGNQFRSFKVKIGIILDSSERLNYEESEKMMKKLRNELLGRGIEIASIIFPCSICGKSFNTELGMKQHMRIVHKKKSMKPKQSETKKNRSKKSKEKTKTSKKRSKSK